MQTPVPLPPGWESTVAPGASPVVVEAFAPTAITAGDIAIIGVLLFGFSLLVIIQLYMLLKRAH